jgi:hypothetical protein
MILYVSLSPFAQLLLKSNKMLKQTNYISLCSEGILLFFKMTCLTVTYK